MFAPRKLLPALLAPAFHTTTALCAACSSSPPAQPAEATFLKLENDLSGMSQSSIGSSTSVSVEGVTPES